MYGPYSIPVKLLKLLDNHISHSLSVLINDSFITGIFPSELKISKVTPLHKKGSNLDPNNYHLICLLSVFSKIYEKVMYARIYKLMENSQLFDSGQFGFRSNQSHSTNHALISITESIKNSISDGKFGCGTFLDLKRHLTQLATVFCQINYPIMVSEVLLLKWFESFLRDRKQFVSVNGISLDLLNMMCGVPQGSVLGPLIFLSFINDLPTVSKKLKFHLFAVDTNIYFDSDKLGKSKK